MHVITCQCVVKQMRGERSVVEVWGVSIPAPTGLVQQLLESALTARAGPQFVAHGATMLGAQPRSTLVAGPGCAH